MPVLKVDISDKQRSRLRNGHKVRVKSGGKICLIVDASKYNLASRAFGKRKGIQLKLDPREILANHKKLDLPDMSSPPKEDIMEGEGLFDDLKKGAKKFVKKGAKTALRVGTEIVKEKAPELVGTAVGSAAAAGATYAGMPQFAPQAAALGYNLGSSVTKSGLKKVQEERERKTSRLRQPKNRSVGIAPPPKVSLNQQVELDRTLRGVNRDLGTNFGYLGTSGLGNLEANYYQANQISNQVADLYAENDGYTRSF